MKLSLVFLSLLLAGTVLLGACTQTAREPAPVPSPAPGGSPASPVAPTVPAVSGTGDSSGTPGVTRAPVNPDPAFVVDMYVPGKAWEGTTLFADNHDPARPRIVEVNMGGEVTWEYDLPEELKTFINPGEDVELLPTGNLLVLFPRKGVYEITRGKEVAWKYLDPKVSHDADRLPDGNTLIAFGAGDTPEDLQVKEVNPRGEIVWSWRAKDAFNREPYLGISNEGWTHTNAVTRLPNGNTLVSPRNFNLLVEVDRSGKVVRTIGEGLIESQHDPEVQPDGNILMINQALPMSAIEMAPNGTIPWRLVIPDPNAYPARDANRLPNGNTLVTGVDRILEVTPDKELVWRLRLKDIVFTDKLLAKSQGFYKAERV
jgi:hypothetical protein